MFINLLKSARVLNALNGAVAGTTTLTGSTIDTQGATSVTFIAPIGTITSTGVPNVKVQWGDASDGSDMADITGATTTYADTGSNLLACIEIVKPVKRYMRVVVTRTTANAVLGGCPCILLGNRTEPQSLEATQQCAIVLAPDAF